MVFVIWEYKICFLVCSWVFSCYKSYGRHTCHWEGFVSPTASVAYVIASGVYYF